MNHTDKPECRNCTECANRNTCKTFYGSYVCHPKKQHISRELRSTLHVYDDYSGLREERNK